MRRYRWLPWLLVSVCVVFGIANAKSAAAPEYDGVETTHLDFAPAGHARTIPLRISWPESGDDLPVILWSHGYLGSCDAYRPLADYWAKEGFIVVQPTHADSLAYGKARTKDFSNWRERLDEVTLILEGLDGLLARAGIDQRADVSHIGIGGHSFGAQTAQLLAGCTLRVGQQVESYKEERGEAFLLISPQGVGVALKAESWAGMTGPVMVITGSEDDVGTGQNGETRQIPYERAPAGDKYLVFIEGADHMFGGIARATPWNHDHRRIVQEATLQYWERYLKGGPAVEVREEGVRFEGK